MLLHKAHLLLHLLDLLLREQIQVELIAEGPEVCHIGARLQRRPPVDLHIRDGGDMGAHADDRVDIGGPVLNLHPLPRIRVVAAPGLRGKVHKPRVKPRASAGAGLKEDLRKFLRQAPIELVDAEDVAVHHLSLPLRRKSPRVRLRHIAVHIPFNIGEEGAPYNLRNLLIEIVHDLLPGKVQDVLMPRVGLKAARRADQPVRMRAVELAVLIYHLKLHPESEVEAQGLDLPGESGDSVRQLLQVCLPVPESLVVIVPLSEPAVVQHEELRADLLRLLRDAENLLLIEVEEGGLPVI